VTIHLDTSTLVDALTGPRRSLPLLERAIAARHVIGLSALVLYEWRRGPRTSDELADAEMLFPADEVIAFGVADAELAANIFRALKRARGRDMDIAFASCAIERRALLWTLNRADFRDLPGLDLYEPHRRYH
jgi:predicted nucleic acid-binding protein